MPAGNRAIGLAKVLTGWTGSLTVTVGGVPVGITPSEPTSAVELAVRVDTVLTALGAQPHGVQVSEAGVLVWSAVASFTLAATGVIQTRLNVAASTTATTVTGAGVHADGFYPARGMSIDSPMMATSQATTMADAAGSTGALAAVSSARLTANDTLQALWAFEDDFGTDQLWDLWAGGYYRARLRIEQVTRERLGTSAEAGRLSMQAAGVFERGPN